MFKKKTKTLWVSRFASHAGIAAQAEQDAPEFENQCVSQSHQKNQWENLTQWVKIGTKLRGFGNNDLYGMTRLQSRQDISFTSPQYWMSLLLDQITYFLA